EILSEEYGVGIRFLHGLTVARWRVLTGGSGPGQRPPFQVEQELLPPQAAAVAAEPAAGVHDPVARDQDADAVLAVGPADRPAPTRRADCLGDIGIGTRLPVGDAAELLPDGGLKR